LAAALKPKIESGAQNVKIVKKKNAVPQEEPQARTYEEIKAEKMKKEQALQ
jgi:hypothetical protein